VEVEGTGPLGDLVANPLKPSIVLGRVRGAPMMVKLCPKGTKYEDGHVADGDELVCMWNSLDGDGALVTEVDGDAVRVVFSRTAYSENPSPAARRVPLPSNVSTVRVSFAIDRTTSRFIFFCDDAGAFIGFYRLHDDQAPFCYRCGGRVRADPEGVPSRARRIDNSACELTVGSAGTAAIKYVPAELRTPALVRAAVGGKVDRVEVVGVEPHVRSASKSAPSRRCAACDGAQGLSGRRVGYSRRRSRICWKRKGWRARTASMARCQAEIEAHRACQGGWSAAIAPSMAAMMAATGRCLRRRILPSIIVSPLFQAPVGNSVSIGVPSKQPMNT
jgi:hypothetical protein